MMAEHNTLLDTTAIDHSVGDILIAEDGPVSLMTLAKILTSHGHSVRKAVNGEDALAQIRSRRPDLVILDVEMPGLDGFEVCNALKQQRGTDTIPVIFCSSLTNSEARINGFRCGAVDFICKPYHSEEIALRVATHLELYRLRNHLEKTVADNVAQLVKVADSWRSEAEQRKAIQKRLSLTSKAFEASFSGIAIVDSEGVVAAVNPAFSRTTGYSGEGIAGREIDIIVDAKNEVYSKEKIRAEVDQHGSWNGEIWCRCKDGNVIPVMMSIVPADKADGPASHFIVTLADLTESKDAQTLIDFLVHRDNLTGLANRTVAKMHFDSNVLECSQTSAKMGIMLLDVDRFKVINDSLGHAAGDQLLKNIANLLLETLGEKYILSRDGGDEFLIITPNVKHITQIEALAETILMQFCREYTVDQFQVYVGASIGAAVYPDHGSNFAALVKRAEQALYNAKDKGGACLSLFREEMDEDARSRAELESLLRQAIQNDEFQLVYQPKSGVDSGQITGAEALIRWNSPQLGFVSPVDFIPLAEETGLILDLDEWVVKSVCRQIRQWKDRGIAIAKVSVNLSALQFKRGDLGNLIKRVLQDSALDASVLDLEITEGMLMNDAEGAIAILNNLKQIGVSISLDDFGTGFSSFSYLQKLPIDTLKVDKIFVDHIDSNQRDANITGTIISLGKSLGLNVVAEGVERIEQFNQLKTAGCDEIQGYWYSKPLSPEDFERFVEQASAVID